MGTQEWLVWPLQRLRAALYGASRELRVAVAIDGDNISSAHANAIFDHAHSLGRVRSANVFANFSNGAAKSWAAAVRHHRINTHHDFAQTAGRNASDVTLVVNTMDHLRDDRTDVFVIVSSDSDLSALARRIVNAEKVVHGIGDEHTPPSFRAACSRFMTLKELHADRNPGLIRKELPRGYRLPPTLATELILVTLLKMGAATTWVSVAELAQRLKERDPTFHPAQYSRKTLTSLLMEIEEIELDRSCVPPRVRLVVGENG